MTWKATLAIVGWWTLWPFAAAEPATPNLMCWFWAGVAASLTLAIWPTLDGMLSFTIGWAVSHIKIVHGPAEFPYLP